MNNSFKQFYFIVPYCLLLLTYVIYRASNLSLTFDEIISFESLADFPLASSNTHLLNSLLMRVSCYFFGNSELAIRLPNVLAFVLYLLGSIKIGTLIKPAYRIHILILLTAMPFVMDFFSLARGYGLGIGFMMLSLAYLLNFLNSNRIIDAILSLLFGMIAVISNYTLLNYFLPLLFVLLLLIANGPKSTKSKILNALIIILLAFSFVFGLLFLLLDLRNGAQLFFGGNTNLLYDTVGSLGRCFAYMQPYGFFANCIFITLFGLSGIVALISIGLFIKNRTLNPLNCFSIIFLFSLLSPVAQNILFNTAYPVERTAIMYYPLMILVLFDGINSILWKRITVLNWIILTFFLAHFIYSLNLTHCYSWRYDSGTKNALQYLKSKGFDKVKLGTDYIHTPSVNFYTKKLQLELEVKVVAECWEYPLQLEELDPEYYSNMEKTSFDINHIILPGVAFYYLDAFFIEELMKSHVTFKVLEEYTYSRSFLIQLDTPVSAKL